MKVRLSMAFEDLRGKDGTVVASRSRTGLVLRANRAPRNPNTASQATVRRNFGQAATAFRNLSGTNFNLWKNYAYGITKTNPVSGTSYHPTAGNVFVGLAAKFLQVNPSGTIPQTPPTSTFAGDAVTLTVSSTTGGVTFTASGPNSANVKTEILARTVPSNKVTVAPDRLKSRAFVAFASGALTYTLGLVPGNFALGYRFVNTLTGQETEVVPLSVATVSVSLEQGGKKRAA